jgi:hypothetical protein
MPNSRVVGDDRGTIQATTEKVTADFADYADCSSENVTFSIQ